MNQHWGASYARGLRLKKEGFPLPYVDALPGRERFHQRGLYIREVGGYIVSYAIDEGASTVYSIALRVGTDLSRGAIITHYRVIPPWPEHDIDWDWAYDPAGVLPDKLREDYGGLVDSRLPNILNERRSLYRGRPVDGLLCGRAWAPIPASYPRETPAIAKIIVVDGSGMPVCVRIELTIYRTERAKKLMRESKVSRDLETAPKSA